MSAYTFRPSKAYEGIWLFPGFSHPKDDHFLCILEINLNMSPLKSLGTQGFFRIYFSMNEPVCIITLDETMIHIPCKQYPVTLCPTSEDDDQMKLFGNAQHLNSTPTPTEHLIFQFDPIYIDHPPIYDSLDGFVYVMMSKKDYQKKKWDKAYLKIDRL